MLVLQIWGGVFIVVVLVVAYLAWRFSASRRLKGEDAVLDAVNTLLPEVELNLESSSPSEWLNKNLLERDEAKLEKSGLIHKGYFVFQSTNSTTEISLWQYQETVAIALTNILPGVDCEDSNNAISEYSVEAMVKLDSGGTVCVSSSESAERLPRPSEHKMVKVASQDVFKLMHMLKDNMPEGTKVVPLKDCKEFFTATYEAVSGWLWQEAQLRSKGLQISIEDALDVELTDSLEDQLVAQGQSNLSCVYSSRILKRLSQSPQMTDSKWDGMREKLVVVHEKMDAQDISDVLYRLVTDMTEDQEDMVDEFVELGEVDDPIASFSELMESLNPGAKRIAKMQRPVVGEIYLTD